MEVSQKFVAKIRDADRGHAVLVSHAGTETGLREKGHPLLEGPVAVNIRELHLGPIENVLDPTHWHRLYGCTKCPKLATEDDPIQSLERHLRLGHCLILHKQLELLPVVQADELAVVPDRGLHLLQHDALGESARYWRHCRSA